MVNFVRDRRLAAIGRRGRHVSAGGCGSRLEKATCHEPYGKAQREATNLRAHDIDCNPLTEDEQLRLEGPLEADRNQRPSSFVESVWSMLRHITVDPW
jgi:hypothetical protein